MVGYTGKLEGKIYVHLAYWVIMIPVLVAQGLQIKYGNTVNKTRLICVGLLVRLLLSNFDYEGRLIGLNYDLRVMSLTTNFFAGSFLAMFLCMFIKNNMITLLIALSVATCQALAWETAKYDKKDF